MNTLHLLSVGIRILGIYLVVTTLRDFPQWWITTRELGLDVVTGEVDLSAFYYFLVLTSVVVVAGLLMIAFPDTITKKLTRSDAIENGLDNLRLESIQYGGLFLLGVYILSWAIPDTVHYSLLLFQASKAFEFNIEPTITYKNSLIVILVDLGIGLYLVFGSKSIVNFVNKLRK